MALERLERHAAARDAYKVAIGQLWELYRGNPRSPRFAIELARQLAICAEPEVRDPRQALTILRLGDRTIAQFARTPSPCRLPHCTKMVTPRAHCKPLLKLSELTGGSEVCLVS